MPSTLQTEAVLAVLRAQGHASNLEIHAALGEEMPQLSLHSVHRITARLLERGLIGAGPSGGRNIVLDANPAPHDHFVCTSCGGIVNLALPDHVIALIQGQLGKNLVRDGITINGRCENCIAAIDSDPDPLDRTHQQLENQ